MHVVLINIHEITCQIRIFSLLLLKSCFSTHFQAFWFLYRWTMHTCVSKTVFTVVIQQLVLLRIKPSTVSEKEKPTLDVYQISSFSIKYWFLINYFIGLLVSYFSFNISKPYVVMHRLKPSTVLDVNKARIYWLTCILKQWLVAFLYL